MTVPYLCWSRSKPRYRIQINTYVKNLVWKGLSMGLKFSTGVAGDCPAELPSSPTRVCTSGATGLRFPSGSSFNMFRFGLAEKRSSSSSSSGKNTSVGDASGLLVVLVVCTGGSWTEVNLVPELVSTWVVTRLMALYSEGPNGGGLKWRSRIILRMFISSMSSFASSVRNAINISSVPQTPTRVLLMVAWALASTSPEVIVHWAVWVSNGSFGVPSLMLVVLVTGSENQISFVGILRCDFQ